MRRGKPSLVQGAVLALIGALGLVAADHAPAAAYQLTGTNTDNRNPAVSPHDAVPVKSVTAVCPDGLAVLGTGGRVNDGDGSVLLTSVAPDAGLTSVTARAAALPGFRGAWSVTAFAVCGFSDGDLTLVTAPGGLAKCPYGYLVLGTGFELPQYTVLTGIVPNAADTAVSVHVSRLGPGIEEPVAYAICVVNAPYLTYHPSVQTYGPDRLNPLSPKVVSAPAPNSWSWVSAVGGQVLLDVRDVHIDMVMPSTDLSAGTIRAVRLSVPGARSQQEGDGDPWSLVLYETSAYYY